jgi:hypothetical protein
MDEKERERITNNAYRDIIMNDMYSYESFVKRFDNAVEKLFGGAKKRIIFD